MQTKYAVLCDSRQQFINFVRSQGCDRVLRSCAYRGTVRYLFATSILPVQKAKPEILVTLGSWTEGMKARMVGPKNAPVHCA